MCQFVCLHNYWAKEPNCKSIIIQNNYCNSLCLVYVCIYSTFTYFELVRLKVFCPVSLSLQLEVKDLQDAINYMHENKKYKKVCSSMLLCFYHFIISLTYILYWACISGDDVTVLEIRS